MMRLIAVRVALIIPLLFGVSLIAFFMLRLLPGDPAQAVLGQYATPELTAQVRHDLGLDQNIVTQYLTWLSGVVRGDFGIDYQSGQQISEVLLSRLPVTIELAILSTVISILVGVPLGVWAAHRRGRMADRLVQVFSAVGIAVPPFWLGIVLILVFSLVLRAFPTSGFVPMTENFGENLRSLVLPAVALAVDRAAVLASMTRSAMIAVLDEDYIRYARAKGIRSYLVIWKHGLRNAGIPVATVIGIQVSHLLGGAVVVEQVFALPGIGQLLVQSMLNRDYPVVQATVLVVAFVAVVANLLTDLLYTVLNPKLRTGAARS